MSSDSTGVAATIPAVLEEEVEMARRREKKSKSRCRARGGEVAVGILCNGPDAKAAPDIGLLGICFFFFSQSQADREAAKGPDLSWAKTVM